MQALKLHAGGGRETIILQVVALDMKYQESSVKIFTAQVNGVGAF